MHDWILSPSEKTHLNYNLSTFLILDQDLDHLFSEAVNCKAYRTTFGEKNCYI